MRHGRPPRTGPPPSTGSRLRDRSQRQRTATTIRGPTTDPNGRNKPFNPKTNRRHQPCSLTHQPPTTKNAYHPLTHAPRTPAPSTHPQPASPHAPDPADTPTTHPP